MNEERTRRTDQLPASFSIETLQEIVRNCQRNEQRLQKLERHTRQEREKAEQLLRETYRTKQDHEKPKQQQPVEYFIAFDNQTTKKTKDRRPSHKKPTRDRRQTSPVHSTIDTTHRVRFTTPADYSIPSNDQQKPSNKANDFDELSRRCEDLLSRLRHDRNRTAIFRNDQNRPQSRAAPSEQTVKLRPDLITCSKYLREEHQPMSSSLKEIKQTSKKTSEQLFEDNGLAQQSFISELQRRNYLRTEILRSRLRQHLLLHGRTNIDESLKMIDT